MLLVSAACTTAPKKFSEFKEGTWQGKVLVRDKKASQSAILNLNVRAIDNSALRVDITSPTGTHLGTLLLKGSDAQFLNVSEKTVLKGKSDRAALQSVLRVPIEAAHFYNILFDHPITQKDWSCQVDERAQPQNCVGSKSGVRIEWVHRERDQRTIEIDHATANLQLSLFGFSPQVAEPDKAFQITVPSSFKTKKF